MNVTNMLNEIINRNRLQEAIQDLDIKIINSQSGKFREMDESVETMKKERDYLQKQLKKYSEVANLLTTYISRFNDLNKKYVVASNFKYDIVNNPLCNDKTVRKEAYKELQKLRNERRKEADIIQHIIAKSVGIIITKDRDSIGNLLEKYGIEANELSATLQTQTEEQLNRKISSLGVDVEKKREVDNLSEIILNAQVQKNNNNLALPKVVHDPEVKNDKTEMIFHTSYKNLEKIMYLHQQERITIKEEQYNMIVNYYMQIIELYQQIQLTIQTIEAYKNSSANKYNESLNKIIIDTHKDIEKLYNKLNKYINSIDLNNNLGLIKDNSSEIKQEQSEFQNDKYKSDEVIISDPSKEKDQNEISNDDMDVVRLIDSYKQRISAAERNIDRNLLAQAQMNYYKINGGEKGYVAPYGSTFYKFLKSNYAGSEEMNKIIECERLKDELSNYIYSFWKKSGSNLNFGDYAKSVQGVEIYSPSSYVEKDVYAVKGNENVDSYVDKKNESLENARKRYQSKNALWRFFNRKKQLENLNVEDMTVEEINNLYGGKGEENNGRTR